MTDLLDYEAIAERLFMLRDNQDTAVFASFCGVSHSDVLRWEKPITKTRLGFLVNVSLACEVPLKWLVFGYSFGGSYFNPREHAVSIPEKEKVAC